MSPSCFIRRGFTHYDTRIFCYTELCYCAQMCKHYLYIGKIPQGYAAHLRSGEGNKRCQPAKCIRPNENDTITTWPCSCRYPFSNRLTKAPHLPTPCPSFPLCVAVYPTRPLRSVKTMVSCHHRHRRPADTGSLQTCPDRHQAPPLHGHPVKLRSGYRRRRGGEGGL